VPVVAPEIPASRRFFRRVNSALLQWSPIYRLYLRMKFGAPRMNGVPIRSGSEARLANATLKTRQEWQAAFERAKASHLPLHRAPEKNWDHLAAVEAILASTPRTARILDAGAEFYSNVLPALFLHGYRELYGINLSFSDEARRGPIRYLPGDLTRTPFPDAHFDAITCLSVIEHGVPLEAYFREMHRLLQPGGRLITSTDYYPMPVRSEGMSAHGAPIKIFSRSEIEAALSLAGKIGLRPTTDLDLECTDKPIRWEPYGLEYTFVIFTLRKEA